MWGGRTTSLTGMPVYAHCPSCGLDFISTFPEEMKSSTLIGNQESCPRCGELANVMEGTFTTTRDSVEMFSGPEWTRAMLIRLSKKDAHKLRTTVAWAQQRAGDPTADAERTAAALEKSLERTAPAALRVLDALGGRRGMAAGTWLMLLITLVMLLLQVAGQSEGEISEDDVRRVVEETVRSVQEESPPAEPAGPTSSAPPREPGSADPDPAE